MHIHIHIHAAFHQDWLSFQPFFALDYVVSDLGQSPVKCQEISRPISSACPRTPSKSGSYRQQNNNTLERFRKREIFLLAHHSHHGLSRIHGFRWGLRVTVKTRRLSKYGRYEGRRFRPLVPVLSVSMQTKKMVQNVGEGWGKTLEIVKQIFESILKERDIGEIYT